MATGSFVHRDLCRWEYVHNGVLGSPCYLAATGFVLGRELSE